VQKFQSPRSYYVNGNNNYLLPLLLDKYTRAQKAKSLANAFLKLRENFNTYLRKKVTAMKLGRTIKSLLINLKFEAFSNLKAYQAQGGSLDMPFTRSPGKKTKLETTDPSAYQVFMQYLRGTTPVKDIRKSEIDDIFKMQKFIDKLSYVIKGAIHRRKLESFNRLERRSFLQTQHHFNLSELIEPVSISKYDVLSPQNKKIKLATILSNFFKNYKRRQFKFFFLTLKLKLDLEDLENSDGFSSTSSAVGLDIISARRLKSLEIGSYPLQLDIKAKTLNSSPQQGSASGRFSAKKRASLPLKNFIGDKLEQSVTDSPKTVENPFRNHFMIGGDYMSPGN